MEKYVDSKGVHRVKGSHNMKDSQHYPIQQLGVDHFLLGVYLDGFHELKVLRDITDIT